jgi:serine/threonine protein kinase
VTEYVGGTTLDTRLANGALPQRTVIQLGIQLAKGLVAAHREQIIHRDLKPGNMRLTSGGELKILDFGIARWREPVSDVAKTLSLEPNETFAGTLPYMRPNRSVAKKSMRERISGAQARSFMNWPRVSDRSQWHQA